MTQSGSFRARLRSGVPQLGVRSQLCNATVAEALGMCGFDYIYLDMEHSPNTIATVLEQARALVSSGAAPVVRVATQDPIVIQQLLDVGIETVVVPMVQCAEEARQIVKSTRYPPRGHRSVARYHRGNLYGQQSDYFERVEDRICVIAQIESRRAVEDIAEIAAVDGVDGLLFGPADLAADMGRLGENDHPEVKAKIEQAIVEVDNKGKRAGMSSGSAEGAAEWIRRGCSFVSIAGDVPLLVAAASKILRDVKGLTG